MTTRDTMELREETIRAQYDAALGLLTGFDHAPRIGKPMEAAKPELSPGIAARPRLRSTIPGLAARHLLSRVWWQVWSGGSVGGTVSPQSHPVLFWVCARHQFSVPQDSRRGAPRGSGSIVVGNGSRRFGLGSRKHATVPTAPTMRCTAFGFTPFASHSNTPGGT